jgi:ATP-dependent Zn protease
MNIRKTNRSVLDRLANEVLEQEVIAGDKLDNLFKVLIPVVAA